MNYNKRPLIGIAGVKHSGKDTVAKLIEYFHEYSTFATYEHWYSVKDNYTNSTIHFADNVKDIVSILFNIKRELLDDADIKDNHFYNTKTSELLTLPQCIKRTLVPYHLGRLISHGMPDAERVIKVRHLLQWIGTDIGRICINENIWVNSCIRKSFDIKSKNGFCIIADVRFQNEVDAIRSAGGIVFKLNRESEEIDNHESEKVEALNGCLDIDNNGGLMGLYYKVYDLVRKYIV